MQETTTIPPAEIVNKPWNIINSLNLILALDIKVREANYFCGLTGSVLQGGDRKDLDIMIMPLNVEGEHSKEKLDQVLYEFFGEQGQEFTPKSDKADDAYGIRLVSTTLMKFMNREMPVDIFILYS